MVAVCGVWFSGNPAAASRPQKSGELSSRYKGRVATERECGTERRFEAKAWIRVEQVAAAAITAASDTMGTRLFDTAGGSEDECRPFFGRAVSCS